MDPRTPSGLVVTFFLIVLAAIILTNVDVKQSLGLSRSSIALEGMSFSDSIPAPGDTVAVTVGVENEGDAPSGKFDIRLSDRDNYTAHSLDIESLYPGERVSRTFFYRVKEEGVVELTATLDSPYGEGAVTSTINASHPPKPGLTVMHSPEFVRETTKVNVTASVMGEADRVSVFLDGELLRLCSDPEGVNICVLTVSGLSPGNHTYRAEAVGSEGRSVETGEKFFLVQGRVVVPDPVQLSISVDEEYGDDIDEDGMVLYRATVFDESRSIELIDVWADGDQLIRCRARYNDKDRARCLITDGPYKNETVHEYFALGLKPGEVLKTNTTRFKYLQLYD